MPTPSTEIIRALLAAGDPTTPEGQALFDKFLAANAGGNGGCNQKRLFAPIKPMAIDFDDEVGDEIPFGVTFDRVGAGVAVADGAMTIQYCWFWND